jgi:myosin heavy subunit
MNHYSVTSKSGDQLCPLGFHPQVRWPTRCKRCFRDYKEHGSRRIEDVSYHASTPALDRSGIDKSVRSWTSTQNLSSNNNNNKSFDSSNVVEVTAPLRQRPSSWSSTPDLDDAQKKFFPKPVEEVTVSLQLPIRRRPVPTPPQTTSSDQVEESFTLRRPSTSTNGNVSPAPPSPSTSTDSTDSTVVINKTDSLAERVRKMQMMKRQGSQERESSIPRNEEPKSEIETQTIRRRRQTDPLPPIPDEKPVRSRQNSTLPPVAPRARSTVENSSTVSEKPIANSLAVKKVLSRTTSDSRVDSPLNENVQKISEENELLRRELETLKTRCEKVEREKSDILLRRLASVDSTANRTAASEVLKLQQKVNEMSQKIEDLEDEKKSMSSKLRNLTSKSIEETLRSKLEQAEKMCESLMDENEEMKKELKNMESEMDELQDNFREEQADDYVTKKRELDQANKNCRVLSFKLKKSEKRIEQLELEKQAGGGNNSNIDLVTKIKQLEDELKVSNEVARRLQSESDSNSSKKKAPTLGKIGKSTSDGGTKVSRESLTRGGSQEDPAQLLRDLQDSIEREADIREQLKFAEEEVKDFIN